MSAVMLVRVLSIIAIVIGGGGPNPTVEVPPGLDLISPVGQPRVGRQDAVVRPGDGRDEAAVERVRVEPGPPAAGAGALRCCMDQRQSSRSEKGLPPCVQPEPSPSRAATTAPTSTATR